MEKEKVIPNGADVPDDQQSKVVTTYHEKKIGNTLYRVTSVHQDKIDLGKALEELTIRKIMNQLREEQRAAFLKVDSE